MSTKQKKTSRGKRYSDAEKAEIIDFVNKMNSEKGRGGQSAASKKFKISPLTISSWLKKSGAPKKVTKKAVKKATGKKRGRPVGSTNKPKAATAATTSSTAPIGKKLAKLQSLHSQIERTETELASLKVQFDVLKASL